LEEVPIFIRKVYYSGRRNLLKPYFRMWDGFLNLTKPEAKGMVVLYGP
jgi:hypothetical protein